MQNALVCQGNSLLIYMCKIHVLSNLLLIYKCKLDTLEYPALSRLIGKMKSSKQNFSEEKFLHIHDIGSTGVTHAAVGRIPGLMYQKLDLGRQIASSLTSSRSSLVVMMLGADGEYVIDSDMCAAVLAAVQVCRLTSLAHVTSSTKITSNAFFRCRYIFF